MAKISMRTINRRKQSLSNNLNCNCNEIYSISKERIDYVLAENYIENSSNTYRLNDNGKEVFTVFGECCKSRGINSVTYKLSDYIVNNIIPKINSYNEASNAISEYKEYIPQDILESFKENFTINETCDRILRNNEKLNKRFNIDKYIYNHRFSSNESIIRELCEFIDTYTIPVKYKYNIALENIIYSFYNNGVDCTTKYIVNEVTDYFLMRDIIIEDNTFISMKNVLCSNKVTDENDIMEAKMLFENTGYYSKQLDCIIKNACTNKDKQLLESLKNIVTENDAINHINETYYNIENDNNCSKDLIIESFNLIPLISNVKKDFIDISISNKQLKPRPLFESLSYLESFAQNKYDLFSEHYQPIEKDFSEYMLESKDLADSKDIKKILDEFKADQNKTPNRFNNMVRRLFTKSPESIIDELPSLLSIVKTCFIFSLAAIPAIGPVISVIVLLVNKVISDHISYKQTEQLVNKLEKEKEKVEKRMDRAVTDSTRKKCEDYISSIDKCISQLEDYMNNIKDKDEDEEDDDFDFGDDDFNFDEAVSLINTLAESSINTLNVDRETISDAIYDSISEFASDYGDLQSFTNIIANCPNIINLDEYKSLLNEYRVYEKGIRECTNVASVSYNLYTYKVHTDPISESLIEKEAYGLLKQCIGISPLLEGVDINDLKLQMKAFKNKIQKLSTKEKAFWKSVDINTENTTKNLQRAMTSDRREAIIKGSLIPSMSKLCKSIMVIAGTSAVGAISGQPWLPVITAVTMFAASKKLNDREKKLIYDEIDTELKVVEKQLEIANNDGDMKQYRFLLNYQKRLEREKLRIKYGKLAKGVPIGDRNSK